MDLNCPQGSFDKATVLYPTLGFYMKGKYMPCSNFSHVRLENPAKMDTLDGKSREFHGFSIAMFDYLTW